MALIVKYLLYKILKNRNTISESYLLFYSMTDEYVLMFACVHCITKLHYRIVNQIKWQIAKQCIFIGRLLTNEFTYKYRHIATTQSISGVLFFLDFRHQSL